MRKPGPHWEDLGGGIYLSSGGDLLIVERELIADLGIDADRLTDAEWAFLVGQLLRDLSDPASKDAIRVRVSTIPDEQNGVISDPVLERIATEREDY